MMANMPVFKKIYVAFLFVVLTCIGLAIFPGKSFISVVDAAGSNVALNKKATASCEKTPYSSSKAVDGSKSAASRWYCNKGETEPMWLAVDLGDVYSINGYSVIGMGSVGDGWKDGRDPRDFHFQKSEDGINWVNVDAVTNNTNSQYHHDLPNFVTRYVRLFVDYGNGKNSNWTSIMEFEVYSTGRANANLSDLKVDGTSVAGFAAGTLSYTVNVPNTTTAITTVGTKADPAASVAVVGGSNLLVGNNTVTVSVTAQDGTTVKTYTVTVVRAGSANANLSALTVDGTSVADFAAGTLAYTVNVPNGKTAAVVAGTKADANANVNVVGGSNLTVGNNTVTVTVTAQDGTTVKVYTITVVRAAISNNADLSDLKVDGTSVANFAAGTLTYTVNVPNVTTSVTAVGTKADPTATVAVVGGSSLNVGDNTITVTVTAQDGTTIKAYTIKVVRAASTNANLSALTVDGTSVANFAASTLAYTVNVPNTTTSVTAVGTKADTTANVVVTGGNNLIVGDNTITVTVTAQDGTTVKAYTIKVARAASANADLSALTVDGTSVANFAAGTLAYTVNVPNATTSVTAVGTKADTNASVNVVGGSNLIVGDNTITVTVTAQDGTTIKAYTIKVVRAASANANLSALTVDGTSVANFAAGTLAYTVNVPNATTSVAAAGTKADSTANVVVTGGSSLIVGDNTITVTVTAQDGTTVKAYTIKVVRAASTNANLSALTVDGTSVTNFAAGTLAYTVNVPNATTSVTAVGTKADATATVAVVGGSSLIVGDNTITVTVTAQDGTTVKAYTIKVVRAASANANLSALTVDGTSVANFAAGTLAYTVNVPNATTSVTTLGTKADSTANVVVTGGSGLIVGDNTITVTVTAQDGTTINAYTIKVVRAASANANLSALTVDGTSVTNFAAGTLAYTVNVPNATTSVTAVGTKADTNANVVVLGGSNLVVGDNTITVTVTAQDGTTVKAYTIKVVRAASANANLSALTVDGTSVANFAAGTLAYTVNVPNATTSVTAVGTKADTTASVVVTGGSNLIVGDNT
ncbi:hypothetical protein FU659_24620, partial [Paenibacillus sp. N3.4]